MSEQENTAEDLGERNERAPDPMRDMARAMLPELLAACGGADAPLMADPVTIPADLARGLLAHLGASLAQPSDPEANAAYTVCTALVAHAYAHALRRAAEKAESTARLYHEYAKRERGMQNAADEAMAKVGVAPVAGRTNGYDRAALFDHDAETCADMARQIRGLHE